MKRLAVLAASALACLAQPVMGQAGEEVYTDPNGWRVLDQQVNCVLFSPRSESQPRLALLGFQPGRGGIEFALAQPLGADLGDDFTLRLGEETAPLRLDRNRRELASLAFSERLHEAFRTSPVLLLVAGDTVVAELSLEGSSEAYGHFTRCVESLPNGPFVPPRAPELRPPTGANGAKPKI